MVRNAADADVVPEIAVIAMGRWGGRELSYASDADAMFVMDDGGPSDGDRTKIAGAVITEMRKLLIRPSADPPLSIDADLRPEGKGGALIRSLGGLPQLLQALVLDLGAPGARSRRRLGR